MPHFCECGADSYICQNRRMIRLTPETPSWTKERILEKLEQFPKWVERGIVAIYEKQTNEEQATENTRYYNNVGFSAFHAKQGSYYAKWILSGKHLSGPHLHKARKMIKHYAQQLVDIANKRAMV